MSRFKKFTLDSLEPRRLLAGISALIATDAADATNTATATSSTAVSLNLNQNQDLTGKIIISANTTPARDKVLWKIDPRGKAASGTTGTFADTADQRTITLTPTPEDGAFDLFAGVDTNDNNQLDDSEIVRTIHLHVLLQPTKYSGVNDVGDTGNLLFWTNPNPSNVRVQAESAADETWTYWYKLGEQSGPGGGNWYQMWDQEYSPGYRLHATDGKASSQYVTFKAKYIGRYPGNTAVWSAVPLSKTDVQVNFGYPGDATSVEITRDGALIATITDSGIKSYIDKNLPPGTYQYQAKAKNDLGYQRQDSDPVEVTLPPAPPSQPTYSFRRGSKGVEVNWSTTTSLAAQYQIFRAEDAYFTKAATLIQTFDYNHHTSTYTDYTVRKGVNYWYRVRALTPWSDGAFYGPGTDFAHLSKGTLTVTGNAADNIITITSTPTRVTVNMDGTQLHFTRSKIKRLNIDARAGFDTVQNDTDIPSTIQGGADDDTLIGGSAPDFIDGGPGIDILTGRAGADTLQGGDGDDLIRSKDHTIDIVQGGAGTDAALFDRVKKYKDRLFEIESLLA